MEPTVSVGMCSRPAALGLVPKLGVHSTSVCYTCTWPKGSTVLCYTCTWPLARQLWDFEVGDISPRIHGHQEPVRPHFMSNSLYCYKQPGTREFKLRSDGKEGNTLFDSVNDKEPRSVWAQKKLRKCIQAWLQPTAEERDVFER